MLIHWQDGPANLRIEVLKTVNLEDNVMKSYVEVPVPGLGHARSHYAELDVVGSDPVYVTGSLYEYQGGPLLARTPTLIDTSATDPWENKGVHDAVFKTGVSGVFSMTRESSRPGYRSTFDDVFSKSDGPAAAQPYPADGATEVSTDTALRWIEAAFATSRELWFGLAGAMEKVEPAPAGAGYQPRLLEFNRTYEWRVDQAGAFGMATGHLRTFTTGDSLVWDGFESYADNAALVATWVHNIPGGYDYLFREAGTVHEGAQAMRFTYQNQFEPYFTEGTHTLDAAQDWTVSGLRLLSLAFRGEDDNVPQRMYVRVEDATGTTATAEHPLDYAVQAEYWRQWDIDLAEFRDAGVDLTAVVSLTIGLGDGAPSGQDGDDIDTIYIDSVRLRP